MGFEPTVPLLAEHTISSRAPSASSGISPRSRLRRPSIAPNHRSNGSISFSFIPTFGGEGGIRTHVRAFGPQVDFESTPLRPLRYLSGIKISTAGMEERGEKIFPSPFIQDFSGGQYSPRPLRFPGFHSLAVFPGRIAAGVPGNPPGELPRSPPPGDSAGRPQGAYKAM